MATYGTARAAVKQQSSILAFVEVTMGEGKHMRSEKFKILV